MHDIIKFAIEYLSTVDDEIFLTAIILEKDFKGRDSLKISVEMELLSIIQHPKVEAVIMRLNAVSYTHLTLPTKRIV